jgi:hypothetical protein
MSKFAKMRESEEEIPFGTFFDSLNHNIRSTAYLKANTLMDIIDRMELSMDDLIKIKTLIAGSK